MTGSLQDMLLLVVSFLLILGGVGYWLYSYIEQQQRKIGVLENVLYELRHLVVQNQKDSSYFEQKHHEEHRHEDAPIHNPIEEVSESRKIYSDPPESVTEEVEHSLDDFDMALPSMDDSVHDLRPGGTLDLNEEEILRSWSKLENKGSGLAKKSDEEPSNEEKNFKSLFVGKDNDNSSVVSSSQTGSPLESMTLKDLRSLGVSRKISGTKSMKRGDLLEALRSMGSEIEIAGPESSIKTLD
jgi:hypothetical protein